MNQLRNLTTIQWIGIMLAVLGVLGVSSAQLTDLFGADTAKMVVTASSLASSIISAVLVALSGQSAQVKAVQAMPGVQSIVVNEKANTALARLAVDNRQDKIETTPQSARAVRDIAAGN